jgi:2-polyprenyl-3-methyl-5-hydroxy-6-metoxy-1,4-benzoquinol methylase
MSTNAASPVAATAPNAHFERSDCPACGQSGGRTVFGEVLNGVAIDVVVCPACGLGYSNPRPTEAYKVDRYREWTGGDRPWQAEAHYDHRQQLRHFGLYRRVMQLISSRTDGGRILDVGCGGGLFLVFAGVFSSDHNSGLNSRYAVEGAGFDPAEVELARRISGATVRPIDELSNVPDGTYDAVTLLNVLEHVNRPIDLLLQIKRVLRPAAPLVVVVPNNEVVFWRLAHNVGTRPLSLASDEHINHFRPASLRAILNKTGFSSVELVVAPPEGNYGSIQHPPLAHWLRYGAWRVAHAAGLGYLYSDIVAVAV